MGRESLVFLCFRGNTGLCVGLRMNDDSVFGNLNMAEEAVADRGHGGDIARLMGVVAEYFAQERDAAGQGVLRDGDVAPDGIEQLFFGDELLWAAQQEEQDAKCLRLHGEHLAVSRDAELALSNFDISKAENKPLAFHHELITSLQGMIRSHHDHGEPCEESSPSHPG